jgi:hypothetical protein
MAVLQYHLEAPVTDKLACAHDTCLLRLIDLKRA